MPTTKKEIKPKLNRPCKKLFSTFKLKKRTITLCAITQGNYVQVGMATCSPEDVYDSSLGRLISLGRAQVGSPKQVFTHLREVRTVQWGETPFTYGLLKLCLEEAEEGIRESPEIYIASLNTKSKTTT